VFYPTVWSIFFLALALAPIRGELASEAVCAKTGLFLAPIDSPWHRKYAPDREIDILHLALDVTPNFRERSVSGQTTLRFKPIAKPLGELRLDAVDLSIASVSSSEKIHAWQVTDKQIILTFEQPILPDRETTVTIAHSAHPAKGLYFRTPEMGYKQGEDHIFTQGEPIEARHWYPCFDAPNEKFTSEVTCRVPEGMVVLSNGRKLSEEKASGTGLIAVRWLQDKPHVNYLITLVAGYFKKIEDRYKEIPMAFWTPPSQIDAAPLSFRDTKDMMAFFEREIGVPYPWDKYDQVCVNDFVAGGMENTSQTTLTDTTLFTPEFENVRSSQGLVAHELAHQWFGDLVTCKDWSHLWLNEGFATYYAHLYSEHKDGRDEMLYDLYRSAKRFVSRSDDTRPIVYRQFDHPMEQFGYHAYEKGAWVLHMLRSQLGTDLYRQCIKTFLERHRFGIVETENLVAVIEELSGRSYDQFFDQWVYHAHNPELEINYGWEEKTRLARVNVKQVQKLGPDILLFHFPLTIRFKIKNETMDRQIIVKEKEEDFYFALPEAPRIVRVDPELALLASIRFPISNPLLHAQLTDTNDVLGRILAVETLATRRDPDSVSRLKQALNSDPFYGVRAEAATALRLIHNDAAFAALTNSITQPDARVRREVISAVNRYFNRDSQAIVLRMLAQEKNPDLISTALQGLPAYRDEAVRETLLKTLVTPSFRNTITEAALNPMRSADEPIYIAALMEALEKRQGDFTSGGLVRALETLGYLARNEDNKEAAREFIAGFTTSKRRNVAVAALNALGTLNDSKALPLLEKFAAAGKESPEREAAQKAIAALRAWRKEDQQALRNEFQQLKQHHRDLQKEMEQLKKKVEAIAIPATTPPAPEKKTTKPRPRGRTAQ
jgi:aminopeptidase N